MPTGAPDFSDIDDFVSSQQKASPEFDDIDSFVAQNEKSAPAASPAKPQTWMQNILHPQENIPTSAPTGEMPGSFEGHPENTAGYVEEGPIKAAVSGGKTVAGLIKSYSDPSEFKNVEKNASDAVSGAGVTLMPAAPFTAAAAPVATAIDIGAGTAGSKIAGAVAHKLGASPEAEEFWRTLGFWAPSTRTIIAKGLGLQGAQVGVEAGEGGTRVGAGSPEGGTRAGVQVTPEGVTLGGQFRGGKARSVTIPRGGKGPALNSNNPIEGEISTPQNPAQVSPPPPPDQMAEATSSMARAHVAEQQANAAVAGVPPTPPPPPPQVSDNPGAPDTLQQGHITPEDVEGFAKAANSLPPAQRAAAVQEAHGTLSKVLLEQGAKGPVVLPSGKLAMVKTPEDAQKIALDIINSAVDDHDKAVKEQQKNAAETKPSVAKSEPAKAPAAQSPSAIEQALSQRAKTPDFSDVDEFVAKEVGSANEKAPANLEGATERGAPADRRTGTGEPASDETPAPRTGREAFQKGDRVTLADGSPATVIFTHPSQAIVRVRKDNGEKLSTGISKVKAIGRSENNSPVPAGLDEKRPRTNAGAGDVVRGSTENVSGLPATAGVRVPLEQNGPKEPVVHSAGAGNDEQLSGGVRGRTPGDHQQKRTEEVLATGRAENGKVLGHPIQAPPVEDLGAKVRNSKPALPRTADEVAPGKIGEMKLSDLNLAPNKFQYKLGHDAEGTSTLLKEQSKFNHDLAGTISVWKDPADGKFYVVNGHHRYELAKRTGEKTIGVRHIKAADATEARSIGAMQNIAEGRGTPIDAAKFMRDTGISAEHLKEKGISLGEATAAKGVALSKLDEPLFNRVVKGDLSLGRAVAIGESTDDPAEQKAILSLVEKKEAKGGKVNDDTLKELIRMVKGSEQSTETTANLFGTQEITRSLALEKAEISAHIKQQLAKDKKLFGFVAKGDRAEELKRAGNKIDVEKSQEISTGAAQAEEVYNKLSSRGGPISAILDESARQLADGENAGKVKSDAYARVRREVSKTLGEPEERSAGRSEGSSEPGKTSEGTPDKSESAVEKTPKYKFGSTQANIPDESDAAKALETARQRISKDDLAGKGIDIGDGGNHLTVRYGIKDDDTAGIRKYLSSLAPFEASLGKTEKFPPSEHSDGAAVINAPVEAPELHAINKEIEKHGNFAEPSFDTYKPHATVAYVKPDKADRYVGMTATEGKTFKVDSIAITDRNGGQDEVKLEGRKAEEAPKETKPEPTPAAEGNREAAIEKEIEDLKAQAAKVSEEFSLQSLRGYDPHSPLRAKYNELLKSAREREDELAKLRGEPTRTEKREMQTKEAEKAFADRPKEALTYSDPKQSQHWQVLEPQYIERRFADKVKLYERAVPEKIAEVKSLKPGTKNHVSAEANLKYWEKLLAGYREQDPKLAQTFKTEYAGLVRKAVSQGRPVPDAVIRQKPEFILARSARERYEKGRHTSFANKSIAVNDTMQKDEGFKVKRQDGKPITDEQIKEISTGVDEMAEVLGPELRDMMRGTDLTISHTNGKHPFLSDAGGMYHPVDRTISAGIDDFLGRPVRALAHELGHWLDYESGRVLNTSALIRPKSGGPSTETKYVSEADRQTKPLYELARRTMSDTRQAEKMVKTTKLSDLPDDERAQIERMKVVLGPYWHEPRELWARMFEQHIATTLGRASLAAESPERYQNMPAWWTAAAWEKIAPLFEEALKTRMDAMRERFAPKAEELSDEPTLPGMEQVPAERAKASAEQQGKDLTAKLTEPPKSIEGKAGEMEQKSPLFRDTDANPQKSMFDDLMKGESGEFDPSKLTSAVSELVKQDVAPALKTAGIGMRDVAGFFVKAIYPRIEESSVVGRALGVGAPTDAVDVLMKLQGERAKTLAEFDGIMHGMEKMFDHMPEDNRIDFIDRIQTGKEQPTPQLRELADAIRKIQALQREQEQSAANLGKNSSVKLPEKQNYFNNRWDKPPGGGKSDDDEQRLAKLFTPRRPLEGSKSYNKKQSYTLKSGIAAGGKPVTTNPIRLLRLRIEDGIKFVTARRAWHDVGELDLRQFVPRGERIPDGFDRVDDKIAKVYFPTELANGKSMAVEGGQWAVEANTARLLNNMLSKDYIRTNPAGKGLMWLKNVSTALELGLSPFHAVFETIEAASAQMALGALRSYNLGIRGGSGREFVAGLRQILEAPVAPISMAREGSALPAYVESRARLNKIGVSQFGHHQVEGKQPHGVMDALRGFHEVRKQAGIRRLLKRYPDLDQLVDDMFTGGLVIGQHEDYKVQMLGKTALEAWSAGNPLGALVRAVPTVLQSTMKPLFQWYIPNLKYSLFMRLMSEQAAENAKALEDGSMTRAEVSRKVADSVENRFGELNFDNLFWHRTWKTALQFAFRSVTWKLGTARELGGGTIGLVKDLGQWAWQAHQMFGGEPSSSAGEGKIPFPDEEAHPGPLPKLNMKFASVIGLLLTTTAIGVIASKILSGKYPWEWSDDEAEGKPETSAEWIKAMYLETVHPRTGDKDSRGKPVRISLPTYWKDVEHLVKDPKSEILGSLSSTLGKGIDLERNEDYFGNYVYNPAAPFGTQLKQSGKYVAPTPFSISSYQRGKGVGGTKLALLGSFGFTKAPSDLDFTPAEKLATSLLKLREPKHTPEELQEWQEKHDAWKNGDLSPKDAKAFVRNQRLTWLEREAKKLTYSEALKVEDAANDNEKDAIRRIVRQKRSNLLKRGGAAKVEAAEATE